jgi:phosphoglycolate phosphatase-like HAD superfamily hydrolase
VIGSVPPTSIRGGLRRPARVRAGTPSWTPKALDPLFRAIPVRREHAVYVGDWYPDVDTARAGEVRVIAVLSGGIPRHAFRREGIPEDHILARLQDLLRLVDTP